MDPITTANNVAQYDSAVGKSTTSVTVIAPARNAAQFFHEWLRVIELQEYENIEVLLVDDGSDDRESKASLRALANGAAPFLRYFAQDNRGPGAARNLAIRAASGDYIAFLDLDDRWPRGNLHRLAGALDQHPDAGIAQGLIRKFVTGDDGRLYYCSDPYRYINVGSSLFRRAVFERCGVFDEALHFGEDFDLMIRCWEQGIRKIEVPEVALLYHRHDGNMTNGKTTQELGALRVYKRRVDRMRAQVVDLAVIQRRGISFMGYIGNTNGPFDEGTREYFEL